MEKNEIIKTVSESLKSVCKDCFIERDKVRIKLSFGGVLGGLKIEILKGVDCVKSTSIKNLLGLNMITAPVVESHIKEALIKLSNEKGISKENINARIYTTSDDFIPKVYLYDSKKPIEDIEVESLIN